MGNLQGKRWMQEHCHLWTLQEAIEGTSTSNQKEKKRNTLHNEMLAFISDRELYPKSESNNPGEKVFDSLVAKAFLCNEIKQGKH